MHHSTTQTGQEQLGAFVAAITEPADILNVRLIPRKGWDTKVINKHWRAADLPSHYAELLKVNEAGYGIYACPNPMRFMGGTRDEHVLLARCLFADIDHVTPDEGLQRLVVMPPPTVILNSGHGVHAYWRLTEPITNLADWRRWTLDLIALLDSDPVVNNPARVMRLPGFLNHGVPANGR